MGPSYPFSQPSVKCSVPGATLLQFHLQQTSGTSRSTSSTLQAAKERCSEVAENPQLQITIRRTENKRTERVTVAVCTATFVCTATESRGTTKEQHTYLLSKWRKRAMLPAAIFWWQRKNLASSRGWELHANMRGSSNNTENNKYKTYWKHANTPDTCPKSNDVSTEINWFAGFWMIPVRSGISGNSLRIF